MMSLWQSCTGFNGRGNQAGADILIAMEKQRMNDDSGIILGLVWRFLLFLCLLIREKTLHSIQAEVRFTF